MYDGAPAACMALPKRKPEGTRGLDISTAQRELANIQQADGPGYCFEWLFIERAITEHCVYARQVRELANPGEVYSKLMDFMERLARLGLIHCDFNEFNVMVGFAFCDLRCPTLMGTGQSEPCMLFTWTITSRAFVTVQGVQSEAV